MLSVKSNSGLLWLRFTSLSDWLEKLAPLSQAMRRKTKIKTNRGLVAPIFPPLEPVICFEFWLVFAANCFRFGFATLFILLSLAGPKNAGFLIKFVSKEAQNTQEVDIGGVWSIALSESLSCGIGEVRYCSIFRICYRWFFSILDSIFELVPVSNWKKMLFFFAIVSQ